MEREEESLRTRDLAGTEPEVSPESEAQPTPSPAMPRVQDEGFDGGDGRAGEATTSHGAADVEEDGALLPDAEEAEFLSRWEKIQTRFVDDPRQAVEDADALVAGVMQRIAEGFAQARDELEGQWSRGEDVGTEELRVALQRYRAFFKRLLSA